MSTLRSRLIRLASAQPTLRPHLLPLLRRAHTNELVYGNKDRHGSFFLTAFAFGSDGPDEDAEFLKILSEETLKASAREYHGVTPRLTESENGVLTVWWSYNSFSSPGAMDDDDMDSEAYWDFEQRMGEAFEQTARRMGIFHVKKVNHAADVKPVA